MTKQEKLYAKYLQFRTDLASYQKEILHKWVKFAAIRGLPLLIIGTFLGRGLDNLAMDIISIAISVAGIGFITYACYQWMEVDPKKFKKGFEWEETLKAYLRDLTVDTDTMEPKYSYGYLNVMDAGLFRHDFIYGGKANVNGVETMIEIIEIGGVLRVFTDKQELVPTP